MATELTRTQGSEGLQAQIGRLDTEASNDFDAKRPWSEITEVTDDNGEKWVRIPKFYTKYTLDDNGNIIDRTLSVFKADEDYKLNPIFLNGSTELEYIEIAKYLISYDSDGVPRSLTGATAIKGAGSSYRTVTSVRLAVDARDDSDYNYQLYDIWTHQLLQDLFTIEYATTDVDSILCGYRYSNYQSYASTFALANGGTDALEYHTGVPTNAAISNDGRTAIKYRYIENPWGNGQTFVDGIYFSGTDIYINTNPDKYSDLMDSSWVKSSITHVTSSGMVSTLGYDKTNQFTFPSSVATSGSYSEYYYASTSEGARMFANCNNNVSGVWGCTQGTSNDYANYRMVRKPIIE